MRSNPFASQERIGRIAACICLLAGQPLLQHSAHAAIPQQNNPSPTNQVLPGDPNAAAVSPIPGLVQSAEQAIKNRDYSTGAQLLEKAVSIDPNYTNLWNYLGWTYNSLGQYAKAESALRKAIELNPKDPRAYNNLGQALSYQKRYDEAIPQYLKQIEINAKDIWAHANLGRIYIQTKQYDKRSPSWKPPPLFPRMTPPPLTTWVGPTRKRISRIKPPKRWKNPRTSNLFLCD